MTTKIRVLIVDDSPLMRYLLSEIMNKEPDFEVVGRAEDTASARSMILKFRPSVITLDIKMPGIDGLSFLGEIMRDYPTPVVMVSYFTQEGAAATLSALELGAVDFIGKPAGTLGHGVSEFRQNLIERVRGAAGARVARRSMAREIPTLPRLKNSPDARSLIAIGSSTGGTEALKDIFKALPVNSPGVLIVQHMPEYITRMFAESLNKVGEMEVREAKEGDDIRPGLALIARGNHHMAIHDTGSGYRVRMHQEEKILGCRPSADILFESVAIAARDKSIGVILTGMGQDGARGLLQIKKTGARTIAQDRKSSVIFGMPKRAIELGAADFVLPLQDIPAKIIELASESSRTRTH